MTTPDLLLLPYRYKTSKLYSIIPSDGSGDFAFTRAVAADRIDADGNTESMAIDVPRIDYELGGCPYIKFAPNSGNFDRANLLGASALIGQTEGVIFVDYYYQINTAGSPFILFPSGTTSVNNSIVIQNDGANRNFYVVFVGGVAQFSFNETIATAQRIKIAFVYGTNNFKIYRNGTLVTSDTSGSLPANLSDLYLGYYADTPQNSMNGGIYEFATFKSILPEAELIERTTL